MFHHHDLQSLTLELKELKETLGRIGRGGNRTTGASTAGRECAKEVGDLVENGIVCSCPFFRNEIPPSVPAPPHMPHPLILDSPPGPLPPSPLPLYYRKHFYGKPHDNYFGLDDELGPLAVSVVKETEEEDGEEFWRVVGRTSGVKVLRGCVRGEGTGREIVESLFKGPRLLHSSSLHLPPLLLKIDEQELVPHHKVGVLLCCRGQHTEESMYNNRNSTQNFTDFLEFLGTRVRLKGFEGYAGGLDVRDNTTGTHSYTTRTHDNKEIMFHVSTLLPFTPSNAQQLPRKRHIGNDMVTIIFQEEGAPPFSPRSVRSQFQHVFLVVRVTVGVGGEVFYGLSLTRSMEVPPFGPPLQPHHIRCHGNASLRDWILRKLVNAEDSTLSSEKFVSMATRTRYECLKEVCDGVLGEQKKIFSLSSLLLSQKTKKVKKGIASNRALPGALSWKLDNDSLFYISQYFIGLVSGGSGGWGGHDNWCISCADVVAYEVEECQRTTIYTQKPNQKLSSKTIGTQNAQLTAKLKASAPLAMATLKYKMTKKNGNFGFHVQNDGLVTDVEVGGAGAEAGLLIGCRLVRLNGVAVGSIRAEEMIHIFKSFDFVELVALAPDYA